MKQAYFFGAGLAAGFAGAFAAGAAGTAGFTLPSDVM